MTLSDVERRDARINFFRWISILAFVPFDLNKQTWLGNWHICGRAYSRKQLRPITERRVPSVQYFWEDHISWGHPRPHSKRCIFWGISLSFGLHPFDRERPHLTCWHMGSVTFGPSLHSHGSMHAPFSTEQSPSAPQFWGFPLFMSASFP